MMRAPSRQMRPTPPLSALAAWRCSPAIANRWSTSAASGDRGAAATASGLARVDRLSRLAEPVV
jgi:hypothetical protein